MNIRQRPYGGEADYDHIRQLLVATLAHSGPPVYATIGDLDWWRVAEDDPRACERIELWFDGERPIAFAWPTENELNFVVHPAYPALNETVLAGAEAYFAGPGASDETAVWQTGSFDGDEARNTALTKRDFRRVAGGHVVYGRQVPHPAPTPVLPPGYSIRHVRGAAESEARAAVQRAAFESEWMTAARHRRVMASPTYRPELDIVIVAPDGSFAAFALVWLDESNRLGVYEPLGVAVAHQRRGLGRALMAEGLRRLAALGATYACVATGIAAESRHLYEASGFYLLDTSHVWLSSHWE